MTEFNSENVYSKSNDMFGRTTAFNHYSNTYTVELPFGSVTLPASDLEWEGADFDS